MSLFRIGALEYEFSEEEGEKAIALHIPSDADLSAEAVDRSMQEADTFFGPVIPTMPMTGIRVSPGCCHRY